METILDHKVTDAELSSLCGRSDKELKNIIRNGTDQDDSFSMIATLMNLRGDENAKERYLAKISDPQLRFDTRYSLSDLA